ncbi:hypothetical protein OPKNFCMD_2281 [Methylobacterium crusticola]|uniref:Uncharacterized protein n=1 Tax=Methylobacterium crusticola TaxID=1697972 RepID=A0ABQ4QXE7_9HYPH|nr:hypothetical protein [Methylobacterium crusticola]GJD49550.1 hypothetical protein OPKNFCMD_2281 [Methylobacterium crusticola]
MDVVLTPAGTKGKTWTLTDRLGRQIGVIKSADNLFRIVPEARSGLEGVGLGHESLDKAMSAIATHMKGSCELTSGDWG